MKLVLILAMIVVQFGPRPPLTPAETLFAPEILKAIGGQAPDPQASAATLGSDSAADILLTCREGQCGTATRAARKLSALVASKTLPQPAQSIRVVSTVIREPWVCAGGHSRVRGRRSALPDCAQPVVSRRDRRRSSRVVCPADRCCRRRAVVRGCRPAPTRFVWRSDDDDRREPVGFERQRRGCGGGFGLLSGHAS